MQDDVVSVQSTVTAVLRTFLRSPELEVVGCGRTDTGVHASKYYLHFDLPEEAPENTVYRINKMLPPDIAAYELIPVEPDAHARFDAVRRTYHYFLHRKKDPFLINKSAPLWWDLDVEAMNKAAALLLEQEDFTSFSKVDSGAHTNICDVMEAHWEVRDHQYVFTISANRFLRNMVRAVVGTLLEVGRGKMTIPEFEQVIAAKDRGVAGTSVPACGLYLADIVYPYLRADE